MKIFNNNDTKVMALGGLGEVGKNMYVVMHNTEIIIIDAGVMFPEDELLGIDYVIPDFTFLKKNQEKIKALIITHGHEDHIGGIPFLIQSVNIPTIYAPNQAVPSIRKKLEERNIPYKGLVTYNEKTKIKTKFFEIGFFATTHSIPDSHGIYINTPNGTIVETGDFKFDLTPIGPLANLHKMAAIGKKGVRLLMSDSTNALSSGFSLSESKVDEALSEIFAKETKDRIILATFASNIYRLKHIVETCRENGRKIALFGRSMESSIEIAIKGGYIKDKSIFITPEQAKKLPPNKVTLLCTGSQGEPLAALSRIANGSHKLIKLMPNDVVIFSSSPIPGNGLSVSKVINKLYLKGAKVYNNSNSSDVHASGHAKEEELKLMLRLINPEYFMPVHGEFRMLKRHADIAIELGMPKDKTFVLENGDVLSITKDKIVKQGSVPASDIYVDGNRIGDVGNLVIKDRKIMSSDGILVIVSSIDIEKHILLAKPIIATRGFVLVNESAELIEKIQENANRIIENQLKSKTFSYNDLKYALVSGISSFIVEETGRNPIILPIVMNAKKPE